MIAILLQVFEKIIIINFSRLALQFIKHSKNENFLDSGHLAVWISWTDLNVSLQCKKKESKDTGENQELLLLEDLFQQT